MYDGDNLDIRRAHIKDESVALINVDAPSHSPAPSTVLLRAPTGEHAPAEIDAFGGGITFALHFA